MRLLLTPSPDKRPDVKKVLQIIQNWDSLTKIELPKEVLEIKAKQLDNNKKSNSDLLTDDEIAKIQQKIRDDEDRKKKKNPYKYQKKDDTDMNEIFGDFEESHETKITTQNKLTNNQAKPKQTQQQSSFDPFGNNQVNNGGNEMNWMADFNKNANGNTSNHKEFDQNVWNFDFIEANNSKNNSLTKSGGNSANFNDIQNVFQSSSSNHSNQSTSPTKKGFDFPNQNPPQTFNGFNDFNFAVQNNNNLNGSSQNQRSKSPLVVSDNNFVNNFNGANVNVQNNSNQPNVNYNNNINRSKSPIVTHQPNKVINNNTQQQDIYDFFK